MNYLQVTIRQTSYVQLDKLTEYDFVKERGDNIPV